MRINKCAERGVQTRHDVWLPARLPAAVVIPTPAALLHFGALLCGGGVSVPTLILRSVLDDVRAAARRPGIDKAAVRFALSVEGTCGLSAPSTAELPPGLWLVEDTAAAALQPVVRRCRAAVLGELDDARGGFQTGLSSGGAGHPAAVASAFSVGGLTPPAEASNFPAADAGFGGGGGGESTVSKYGSVDVDVHNVPLAGNGASDSGDSFLDALLGDGCDSKEEETAGEGEGAGAEGKKEDNKHSSVSIQPQSVPSASPAPLFAAAPPPVLPLRPVDLLAEGSVTAAGPNEATVLAALPAVPSSEAVRLLLPSARCTLHLAAVAAWLAGAGKARGNDGPTHHPAPHVFVVTAPPLQPGWQNDDNSAPKESSGGVRRYNGAEYSGSAEAAALGAVLEAAAAAAGDRSRRASAAPSWDSDNSSEQDEDTTSSSKLRRAPALGRGFDEEEESEEEEADFWGEGGGAHSDGSDASSLNVGSVSCCAVDAWVAAAAARVQDAAAGGEHLLAARLEAVAAQDAFAAGSRAYVTWARSVVAQRRLELALAVGTPPPPRVSGTAGVALLPTPRHGVRQASSAGGAAVAVGARGTAARRLGLALSQLEPGVGRIPVLVSQSQSTSLGGSSAVGQQQLELKPSARGAARARAALAAGAGLRTGLFRALPGGYGAVGFVLCPALEPAGEGHAYARVWVRGRAAVADALDGDVVEVAVYASGRRVEGSGSQDAGATATTGSVVSVLRRRQAPVAVTLLPTADGDTAALHVATAAVPLSTAFPPLLQLYPPFVAPYGEAPGAPLRALAVLQPPQAATRGLPPALAPAAGAATEAPRAAITAVLGAAGTQAADVAALLHSYGLGAHVGGRTGAAQQARAPVPSLPRRDLAGTGALVFSIDSPGTLDIDDCLSLRVIGSQQVELGVHITDVAAWLPPGTSDDVTAALRGTTLYGGPGARMPMLGMREESCAHPASLSPGCARPALSLLLSCHARDGGVWQPTGAWVGPMHVTSKAALSFSQANAALTGSSSGSTDGVAAALVTLEALAQQLWRGGYAAGKEEEDEAVEGGRAGRIVASLMLTANRLFAAMLKARFPECPLVRPFTHAAEQQQQQEEEEAVTEPATPVPSVSARIAATAARFGLVPASAAKTPAVTTAAAAAPAPVPAPAPSPPSAPFPADGGIALPVTWLRALFGARALPSERAAIAWYTLGTSPLRRYTDVMVQRLLHAMLAEAAATGSNSEAASPVTEVAPPPQQLSATSACSATNDEDDDDDFLSELLGEERAPAPAAPVPVEPQPALAPSRSVPRLRLNMRTLSALALRQRSVAQAATAAGEALKAWRLAAACGLRAPGSFVVLGPGRCLAADVAPAAVASFKGSEEATVQEVALAVSITPHRDSGSNLSDATSVQLRLPLGSASAAGGAASLLLPPCFSLSAGTACEATAAIASSTSPLSSLLPPAAVTALGPEALPAPRPVAAPAAALQAVCAALVTPTSSSSSTASNLFIGVLWEPELVTGEQDRPATGCWLHPPRLQAFLLGNAPAALQAPVAVAEAPAYQQPLAPHPWSHSGNGDASLSLPAVSSFAARLDAALHSVCDGGASTVRPQRAPRKVTRFSLQGGTGRLRFGPPGASFAHLEVPKPVYGAADDADVPPRRVVYLAPELPAATLATTTRSAGSAGTAFGAFLADPTGVPAHSADASSRFVVRDVSQLQYDAFTAYGEQAPGAEVGAAASRVAGLERDATTRAARLRAEKRHDRIDKQKKAEAGGGGGGGGRGRR